MENIGGGLGFRATLDIDDFNVSARVMEDRIRDVSSTAIAEADSMDNAFSMFAQKAGQYISYYLVGQGMMNLLNSIVQVRGQFQQLEIAFGTMLGSEEKAAALMDQMVETAAKTPFDLMGVAGGAKQLMAYGVEADKVNDILVRLGNIASGLSIPLNDIVYLYGTTMVQGRLYAQDVRQFTGRGIPLVKELADKYHKTTDEINAMVSAGEIGFADVEEVINKMTDAGGQFYNLMEKQSASLTGQISNLEDAWDTVLNDWGKANEGLFYGAIQGATWLVEHMDGVVRILKTAVTVWGTYKAAVIANTLATKGYTGVALIDNTVRSAKIALQKAEAIISGEVAAQTKAMAAVEAQHIAALEAEIGAEESANILKQMRVAAIQSLLTAQQQEYLSILNITTASAGYEAAAMGILTVDQRAALSKMDLTTKSGAYKAALQSEVAAKRQGEVASLEMMRVEVKEAAVKMESAKQSAISAQQAAEAARYEVYWAKQSGDAVAVATAQKKLAGLQDNAAIARKAALAASSDFYTKKKLLESAATKQGTAASVADATAKQAQATATTILSGVTTKATAVIKTLWATMAANPIGAIITVLGAAISALMLFSDSNEEASESSEKFGESTAKQIANLNVLFATLNNTDETTKTHKETLQELNEELKKYNLALIGENATAEQVADAHNRLENAIQKEANARERANSLQSISDEYTAKLDKIKEQIQKELQEAHHFDYNWRLSFDSEDIQNKATALSGTIRGVIEDELPKMANLDPSKMAEAKQKLRDKITQIMVEAGVDASHASFITDYNVWDNTFYDVFSEKGGIIDKAVEAKQAFDSQTEAANNAADAAERLRQSTYNVADAMDESNSKADFTTFTLEQLHQLEAEMAKAELTIDISVYGYTEAMSMINDIKAAIGIAQNNLNTEEGIGNEIQTLTAQRKKATIGSQEWKDLDAQIKALQGKLPGHSGGGRSSGRSGGRGGANDAARNAENLRKKQLEADRKYEEARIAIMEEGYEKRKAQLDYEHKLNLQRIDDERKELEDARRKAGKGELSADELAAFNDRIRIENESYMRSQNQLMIGEIAEKKKQYELYYRWVHNMGEDVANAQFADLLKNGASFKSYLESEIQKLKDRQRAGETLSSQDNTYLFTLQSQLDEISGLKTAMDQFKESVSKSLGATTNLAEKLEAIAKAKKDLADGTTGLVGDKLTEAALHLDELERDAQEELHNKVITEYRSYEEQKASIQKQYQLEREEAQRMGDKERIKLINKAEAEALSALNMAFLQQSDTWKRLFDDIDNLSVSQLQTLIDDIQKQIDDGTLELSPVDYKAVIDSLNKAKEELLNRNPFKALGKYYDDYVAAKKKLAKAKLAKGEGSQSDVDAAEAEVKRAGRGITDAIQSVMEIAGGCAKSLQDMFDALGMEGVAEGIGTALELMGELGNMAGSVGKLMSGDILGGVTGLISSAASLVGIFAKLHDKKYEKRIQNLQEQIDNLERSYSRLERAFNNTYWVFSDAEKEQFEKNIDLIEQQIAALEEQRQAALKLWDIQKYAKLTAEITKLKDELNRAKESGDILELYQYQIDAFREQQELIRQQIEAEKAKKKTDKDKIQQYEEQIESIEQQIEDLDRQMMETFAGTDVQSAIDEFADALVDAYCAGEDAAKALAETTKKVLKNAVVEALKREFLAKAINDAVVYLGGAMSDGVLTDEEKATFEAMVNGAGDVFNNALEGIGDWIKDMEDETESDPLTGAVKSMNEETAGVIAGRLNAFIINQTEQTNVLRDQLMYQYQIAQNTAISASELQEIKATLKRIETKDSSLLSQGIS